MLVTKTFNVDLVRLEVPPTWACMQGDANSRAICYRLYSDGLSYEIPSGVSLRIAYEKADKTSGVYSQLPDGSSAYEISGNTVTIRLIEDVSAKSGMALVQPILYDSDGNILGIWSTEIVVWRGVSKESSSTGVNYSSYENDIGTLQARVKRLESLVDGGSTTETYGITQSCTNCSSSSNISAVNKNDSFTATYTPNSGYSSISFIVKMGGTDITTNSVSGNRVTISKVTGNVVITANGVRETTYTVSFSGVSGIPSQTVAAGGYASEPPTPTKDGYIFDGWYNGNSKWNFNTDKVTSNITLTAKFNELIEYTITTNYSESGIPSNTTTVNSGESYSATIEIPSNFAFRSATVKMGGTDITTTALSGKRVTINKVTDNVVITVNVNQTFQIVTTTRGVTLSNTTSVIAKGSSYECTVTPTSGYNAVTITVHEGSSTGTDATGKYVSGNKINIPSVAFDVYITANGYTLSNYDVTNNLTNCTTSNNATTVEADASYTATVTQSGNYKLKALTVKMGGTDITNDVVTYSTTGDYNIRTYVSATINIPKVTGKVEITGTGAMWYWMSLTTSNCSKKRTTGCVDSQHDNYAWDGDTYVQAYKPDKEYTSVSITVKRGSSDGTDVTSSVVGKTTIDGVSYDSVTINNVKDKYYIRASGTN